MSRVKIPEYVANWIRFCKDHGIRFFGSVDPIGDFGEPLSDRFSGDLDEILRWIKPHQEKYLEAWVNGYECEPKKYVVTIKSNDYGSKFTLIRRFTTKGIGYEWSVLHNNLNTFTKDELVSLGLEWVLTCPDVSLVEMASKSY